MQTAISIGLLVLLIGIVLLSYFKGRKDEERHQLARSVDDLLESKKKQEQREATHDERMRHILDGPVSADDGSRMLQEWPSKTTPSSKTDS